MVKVSKMKDSEGLMLVTDYVELKELADKIMEMMVNENLLVHEAKFVIKELKWNIKNHQYLRTRQENLDQQL